MPKSISDLAKDFFIKHPNQDCEHCPVVDFVEQEYMKMTGKKPRDTWRCIRKLHEVGFLIKVRKGIYRYDPNFVMDNQLADFTEKQKVEILARDDYKCVQCGRGIKDGVELHVDHIKPKSRGGNAMISNGQTLCAQHNFIKKNLNQTETGKKMFILLYELSKSEDENNYMKFCEEILNLFDKYNINGHIEWNK